MASIIRKRIKGSTYYYARECQRVDGRPKIVWQKYLGTAVSLIEAVNAASTPPEVEEVDISEFGGAAALYDIAQRLQLVEIVDRHVPKRKQGLSVGQYMLIAAINRCLSPGSKAAIGDWFMGTPLRRWMPAPKRALSSQRFWDHMDKMDAQSIRQIEADLTSRLVEEFQVDTSALLYDTTNFFTFIDSFNDASTLARRGKSKEQRSNLRIVGLALMVSLDHHIPLFHECYSGNVPDCSQFASVAESLVERHRQLRASVEDMTLVFDKGNNSQSNMATVESSPFHFVGSLQISQFPDLLDVSREEFEPAEHPALPGVSCYRTQRTVFGVDRTVVVVFNESLYLTQSQSLFREAHKRLRRLGEVRASLLRRRRGDVKGGKLPTEASIREKAESLLRGQHIKKLISVAVGEEEGLPTLDFSFDQNAFVELSTRKLGKTVLFTDQNEWPNETIVLAYRGQAKIETLSER